MLAVRFLRFVPVRFSQVVSVGELGSGPAHSGGGGGSIREAGGAFGRLEAAYEEKYFHDLTESQVHLLKCEIEERARKKLQSNEDLSEIERLAIEASKQRRMLQTYDPE